MTAHISDRFSRVQAITARFAALPEVQAVALAGSLAAGLSDDHSDLDLYIYIDQPISLAVRTTIAHEFAGDGSPTIEIDKPFWGPEDAWTDRVSGSGVDLIYWSPQWIEEQLDRTLVQCQAWMGYTTSFWHTIRESQVVYDRAGWFMRLKQRAEQPYPEALRRAIIKLNYPVLRQIGSSYRHQIELAILRQDRISVNHRVTALLASYFDILFAVNAVPHPGEKRLVAQLKRLCIKLPTGWESQLDILLEGNKQRTLVTVDALLDGLDDLLRAENLLPG